MKTYLWSGGIRFEACHPLGHADKLQPISFQATVLQKGRGRRWISHRSEVIFLLVCFFRSRLMSFLHSQHELKLLLEPISICLHISPPKTLDELQSNLILDFSYMTLRGEPGTGACRQCRNEPHNLYCSPDIRVIKSTE
jgi:hypothetical protein